MKTTGGSGGRTVYGDKKLIYSIAKLLYDSHNYTRSEEKVLSASADRSIVVCVANKGVISLSEHSQVQNGRKVNQPSSKPVSNMSDIELNDLRVNQI